MRCPAALIVLLMICLSSCTLPMIKDPTCVSSAGNLEYDTNTHKIVAGIVRHCAGAPLADVKVTFTQEKGEFRVCTYTTSEGKWQISLSKGTGLYEVHIDIPNYGTVIRRHVDPDKLHLLETTFSGPSDPCGNWTD